MHDPLIRRLASNGKVKSAATRGPGFSWPGSAPQAGAFSGFQYLAPPERLSDKTVRDHWERARKVDIAGQAVQISPDGPLGDAAWAKQQLSRATQALANGYCQLPLVQTCPHANAPLTELTPIFLV